MCGIAGILDFDSNVIERRIIENMTRSLYRRGPDDRGIFLDKNIALGHCRLKVIDITQAGQQPMCNEDDSIRLIINGMIYNFKELRSELEKKGHHFKSKTDIEIVLHLYEELGMECFSRLRGMFALAIWDRNDEKLILARDRIGQKPLVYMQYGNRFYFASEPKAIFASGEVPKEIDFTGMHHMFSYKSAPWPYTMFDGLNKLPPATILEVDFKEKSSRIIKYWNPDLNEKIKLSEQECVEKFTDILQESVKIRMISDVPIGALLSGGVDSSTNIALMSKFSGHPVETFSVGYDTRGKEDADLNFARIISEKFSTNHHEVIINKDILATLPEVLQCYDEPYAIPIALANFELCRAVKKNVTVALSGDGADETLGGYPGYLNWRAISWLDNAAKALNIPYKDFVYKGDNNKERSLSELLQVLVTLPEKKRSLRKNMYSHKLFEDLYSPYVKKRIKEVSTGNILEELYLKIDPKNFLDGILYLDLMLHNTHGVCTFSDISGMSNAVEIRSPFLDHKFVEFTFALPFNMKVRGFGDTKFILRKAAKKFLPQAVLSRRKYGYGEEIPFTKWFRNEWKSKAEEVILHESVKKSGFFNMDYVKTKFDKHMSFREDNFDLLWQLFCFGIWYENNFDN